ATRERWWVVAKAAGFCAMGNFRERAARWVSDAIGTMFGALTGTSTVTSYIESASGVAAGARTGLGNILIAVLFLMAMFCSPLVAAIPTYATAPALVLVGVLMSGAVARILWDDFSEAFPAFLRGGKKKLYETVETRVFMEQPAGPNTAQCKLIAKQ